LWSDVAPAATDLCYTLPNGGGQAHQTPDDAARALSLCLELLDNGSITREQLDVLVVQHFDGQKGRVYWPLRVALSGSRNSAGPLDIIAVIGPKAASARIQAALSQLQPS
jgi:hypothetical protein